MRYGNQVWFTDPQIQAFIREKGLADEVELEHYFMRRMVDSIVSKGKAVIAWDEIVGTGISPDKAVVMWWRHDKPAQLRKALDGGYRIPAHSPPASLLIC
ncbi:MAG: family 20 glycosylhydrolase [Alistipes indistinctus]